VKTLKNSDIDYTLDTCMHDKNTKCMHKEQKPDRHDLTPTKTGSKQDQLD